MEFIVITGPTFTEAMRKVKRTLKINAGIELRLDLFKRYLHEEVKELINLCHEHDKKVILTQRSSKSGGGFTGSVELLEERNFKII